MKNPVLVTLIVTLSLIASSAFAQKSSSSRSKRGGAGDGGGNVKKEELVGSWQVERWLDWSKEPVRYVLYRLEFVLLAATSGKEDIPGFKELNRKLFLEPKTIYQALDEAIFVKLPTGGCEDLGGNEHDASALKNAPNICFAMEPLSEKLYKLSGQPELAALIVHEISHLVGTTETEAEQLQEIVQNDLSSNVLTLGSLPAENRTKLKSLVTGSEEALRSIRKEKGATPLCSGFGMLVAELSAYQSNYFEVGTSMGITFLKFDALVDLQAALMKAINVWAECSGKMGEQNINDSISKAFKGRKQVSYQEFSEALPKEYDDGHVEPESTDDLTKLFYPKGVIIRDVRKNAPALAAEVREIENLLKGVYDRSK